MLVKNNHITIDTNQQAIDCIYLQEQDATN